MPTKYLNYLFFLTSRTQYASLGSAARVAAECCISVYFYLCTCLKSFHCFIASLVTVESFFYCFFLFLLLEYRKHFLIHCLFLHLAIWNSFLLLLQWQSFIYYANVCNISSRRPVAHMTKQLLEIFQRSCLSVNVPSNYHTLQLIIDILILRHLNLLLHLLAIIPIWILR